MKLLDNRRGISLLEVLLVVGLVSATVVTMSLAIPQSSLNTAHTVKQQIATELAATYLTDLKSQPYPFVEPTDSSFFGVNPCDCTTLNFSVLPSTTSTASGTVFSLKACVNFVSRNAGNWVPSCPSASDPGYKNLIVRVSWTEGARTGTVTQTSSIARF